MAVIGLFIGYFVLKGIAKLNHKQEHMESLFDEIKIPEEKDNIEESLTEEKKPKTKIWNIWYTLGVILCLFMAVLQEIVSRM